MTTTSFQKFKKEVLNVNKNLWAFGLSSLTNGNASGLYNDGKTDLVVIKPSGVYYSELRCEDLVVVDLKNGNIIEGTCRPSVDLEHHILIYQNFNHIKSIVHTHSCWATSFASLGRSIPAYITEVADLFGEEIRCIPYVDNSKLRIGQAMLPFIERSKALLLEKHGIFTFGEGPKNALALAVAVEKAAQTCFLAEKLGHPERLNQDEVMKWHQRYQTDYGQKITNAESKSYD